MTTTEDDVAASHALIVSGWCHVKLALRASK